MSAAPDREVPADERWVIAGFTRCRDLAYLNISYSTVSAERNDVGH